MAPSCIKRGTRGAKRGVPHKRRQHPDAPRSSSSLTTSVVVSDQSCVTLTQSPTATLSFDRALEPPPGLVAVPSLSEFSMISAACSLAPSTASSSTSSVDSYEMSSGDVSRSTDVKLPMLSPISRLLVANVAC